MQRRRRQHHLGHGHEIQFHAAGDAERKASRRFRPRPGRGRPVAPVSDASAPATPRGKGRLRRRRVVRDSRHAGCSGREAAAQRALVRGVLRRHVQREPVGAPREGHGAANEGRNLGSSVVLDTGYDLKLEMGVYAGDLCWRPMLGGGAAEEGRKFMLGHSGGRAGATRQPGHDTPLVGNTSTELDNCHFITRRASCKSEAGGPRRRWGWAVSVAT